MTKLQKYLNRKKLRQADFAVTLGVVRGWPIDPSQVSRWCSGERVPCMATRVHIEQATGGKVSRRAWS